MLASDALCDIAETILPERGGLIAVIHHAYFDESGTHDDAPVMTIGTYLFSAEQARKFSRDWGKDLKRLGLPFAHMADCALGFGAYKNLTLERRIESEKLLIGHIKRRSMVGFAIAVSKPSFEVLMRGFDMESLYTFLLQVSVLKIRDLAVERRVKKIAYFFESGHRFASEAHKYFNIMATLPNYKEYFLYAGHSFVDKAQALPLQAADMLAWQECHYRTRQLQGHDKRRKDFDALTRPIDRFTKIQPEDLLKLRAWKERGVTPVRSMPPPLLQGLLETGAFVRTRGHITRGDVLAMCPKTGLGVSIGFNMTKRAFETTKLSGQFQCAGCGEQHSIADVETWHHE